MDKIADEGRAWVILQRPAPRGRYEHARNWEIRNNHRKSFVARINRTPGGCWVWTGQRSHRREGVYPIVGWRTRVSDPSKERKTNVQKSAFTWMIDEWFPAERASLPHRTKPGCGEPMCLNPYHRVDRSANSGKIDAERAVAIYAYKDTGRKAEDVAEEFGLSRSHIINIWKGRNWSKYTGAVFDRKNTRQITPPDVVAKIEELQGSASGRSVAKQFNISHRTVQRIWDRKAQRLLGEQAA